MRIVTLALVFTTLLAACGSQRGSQDTAAAVQFHRVSADDVAHGKRLSSVLGCRGCHGEELQGERFYELYASNLTRDVATYSDEDLKRLLREGAHPTGRDVWGMPSELFQHLSTSDEAALISYLRTLKPAGQPTQPRLPWAADAKRMISEGKIKPAAATVRETKTIGPIDLGPRYALGRYVTRVTCAECHGAELQGGDGTPDLIVASGYSREEFDTLMTEGIAIGNRKLNDLMVRVARGRFAHLTPGERHELYNYLKARAEKPQ